MNGGITRCNGKIMYCATPTRLKHLRRKIIRIARRAGYVPIFPFDIGRNENLEDDKVLGRKKTLKYLADIMKCGDAVGIFGISDGTMYELFEALAAGFGVFNPEKEIRVFYGLDPKWEEEYKIHEKKYGDLLARLTGQHYLFVLVGPSAVGKTFWSDYLIKQFPGRLQRIKTVTTRPPRNEKDHGSYDFVTREEFERGIEESRFMEYVYYHGHYHGSSWQNISKVLKVSSGIFALTPSGVEALWKRRFEINLKIIRLVPETKNVLEVNLNRRGIFDQAEREKLLSLAPQFVLPEEIKHDFIFVCGDATRDESNFLKIIEL